ncbi:hypothetical protein AB0C04_20960 [Micromonospora sp. NPDC048909]|uniref:hypothetical protein n=1 Tax=Micromonospora sp. NPDC048909 TaxID=3155643 RepID=UPI00340D3A2D
MNRQDKSIAAPWTFAHAAIRALGSVTPSWPGCRPLVPMCGRFSLAYVRVSVDLA